MFYYRIYTNIQKFLQDVSYAHQDYIWSKIQKKQ